MRAVTILAAVALAAAPPLLVAQQPPGVVKGGAVARAPGKTATVSTAQIIAIVERVDAANRTVSLKGPRGVVTMDVGEEVRNLPQVKVGDRVVVTYAQALALELKKGGSGIRERIDREGGVRAAPGERPGAAVGREVRVVADVMVVNMKNQSVTLRGPNQTVTLKVRDPAQFKNITAGDQVEATYTEALALAVKPVKPALVATGR